MGPPLDSRANSVAPDVAVVIVTHQSAHVIDGLLDSLPAALGGLTADVVVVDNGSTDETAERVGARTDCRLVRSANVGYAGGLNRGVREAAAAPALLMLNPDVRLEPGSIPALLAALQRPGTAVVAPQVRDAEGRLYHSLRREPSLRRAIGLNFTRRPAFSEYVNSDADYTSPRQVDWALGAALMVSRDSYDRLGGWDESYFLYSEETDFSLRARDLGLITRYEPRAVVVHIGGQSGQSDVTHAMLVVNRVRLYRRRHGSVASFAYFGLSVLSELSWLARGQSQSRRSVEALLRPKRRPAALGASHSLIPR